MLCNNIDSTLLPKAFMDLMFLGLFFRMTHIPFSFLDFCHGIVCGLLTNWYQADSVDLSSLHNVSWTFLWKRGRRGGIRAGAQRLGLRLSLPSIVFGNIRSLNNKIDELYGRVKYQADFWSACSQTDVDSLPTDPATHNVPSVPQPVRSAWLALPLVPVVPTSYSSKLRYFGGREPSDLTVRTSAPPLAVEGASLCPSTRLQVRVGSEPSFLPGSLFRSSDPVMLGKPSSNRSNPNCAPHSVTVYPNSGAPGSVTRNQTD